MSEAAFRPCLQSWVTQHGVVGWVGAAAGGLRSLMHKVGKSGNAVLVKTAAAGRALGGRAAVRYRRERTAATVYTHSVQPQYTAVAAHRSHSFVVSSRAALGAPKRSAACWGASHVRQARLQLPRGPLHGAERSGGLLGCAQPGGAPVPQHRLRRAQVLDLRHTGRAGGAGWRLKPWKAPKPSKQASKPPRKRREGGGASTCSRASAAYEPARQPQLVLPGQAAVVGTLQLHCVRNAAAPRHGQAGPGCPACLTCCCHACCHSSGLMPVAVACRSHTAAHVWVHQGSWNGRQGLAQIRRPHGATSSCAPAAEISAAQAPNARNHIPLSLGAPLARLAAPTCCAAKRA